MDNSWSAQQKLPFYIKRNREYEERMRSYLYEIDSHKQHIAGRKDDDEANKYCKGEIEKYKNLIKEEVKNLKDIQFNGKLAVTLSTPQEILIVSLEDDFDNSKFILKEDLESSATSIIYLGMERKVLNRQHRRLKIIITSKWKMLNLK